MDDAHSPDQQPRPSRQLALFGASTEASALDRPYPSHYVETLQLKDGTPVVLRPIAPSDEALMVRFHEELGEESVISRYAGTLALAQRTAHERLKKRCHVDYETEMALVAEARDEQDRPRLLGIGRLVKTGATVAEFGLVVVDDAQGAGLGTLLLDRLVRFGLEKKLDRIEADIAARNRAMQHVAQNLGFEIVYPAEISDPLVRAVLVVES